MKRLMAWVICGIAFSNLCFSQALAQEPPAGSVAADRSTPRGTLKVLTLAMQAADADAMRSILAAANPTEQKMVDAMVETATSARDLREAAIAAYGADAARPLTGDAPDGPEAVAMLDEATETLTPDGQVATVSFVDVGAPEIRLIKQAAEWQVPVADLSKGLAAQAVDDRLTEVKATNEVMREIARDVAAKKFATAEEARRTLHDRLLQAVMPPRAAATQPTTQPAIPPATQPMTAMPAER